MILLAKTSERKGKGPCSLMRQVDFIKGATKNL